MLYEAIDSYLIWNQFKNYLLGRKWGGNNSDLLTILQPYVLEDSCVQLVFLICLAHWLLGDFVELNTLHSSGNRVVCKEDRIFFIISWIMMWLLWTHNLFCSSRNHTSSRSTIQGTCTTCMYSHAVQFHETLKKNYAL